MNLTHQQQDLLRLLVSKHEASGGQPFIFVRSMTGAGLCYPSDSVPVANDDLDFHQLHHENLIAFTPVGTNKWRGKPTELGIAAVRGNFILAANESDDPWKNPFPEGTRAHEIVRDTMLWTKEHLALFHSEMLASMPPEEASSKEFVDHHLKALAGAFDIWAGALSRSAVLSDDAADAFEHLLTELEKVMVATAIKRRPSFIPERVHASEVRNRLNERKQYWVGQMLRRVREHKDATRANAAASLSNGPDPNAVKVTEPNAGAESDGVATPQETTPPHVRDHFAAAAEPAGEGPAPVPALRTELIKTWMDDEGWTNEALAGKLQTSERVISSLRNNGKYHGRDAVTKLANLMERDPVDLYLP